MLQFSDSCNTQVKDGENDHPQVGYSSPLLTLWQKQSTRFETPKAVIYLDFACPNVRPLLDSTSLGSRHNTWGSVRMLPAFTCHCFYMSNQSECSDCGCLGYICLCSRLCWHAPTGTVLSCDASYTARAFIMHMNL